MKRIVAGLAGALALIAVAAGCIPSEEPWAALDSGFESGSTGWTPTAPQNLSPNSRVVNNRTADLVWFPRQPNSYLGTSLETDNLGLDVEPGDVISVTYGLSSSVTDDEGNVMTAGGAIRLFSYNDLTSQRGDRPDTAPTYVATAPAGCATGCTMSFEVTEPGQLGYTGLVYDTSNGGVQGRVRFRDLTVTRAGATQGDLLLFE